MVVIKLDYTNIERDGERARRGSGDHFDNKKEETEAVHDRVVKTVCTITSSRNKENSVRSGWKRRGVANAGCDADCYSLELSLAQRRTLEI